MQSSWLRLAAALAFAVLAGCATLPVSTPPSGVAWNTRRPQLQAREHFELRGRVAVAAGSEGFNANVHWTQNGTLSLLTLEGPLGVGGAQITASGAALTLVTSRGEHLDSNAAHAALAARLGFDPPLSSLRFWVLGVPDPSLPADETLDSRAQRLSALAQAGWRIDYTAYAGAGVESLPARLTLQRAAVRVRLLVDDWGL